MPQITRIFGNEHDAALRDALRRANVAGGHVFSTADLACLWI
jgi:hypothetical protein